MKLKCWLLTIVVFLALAAFGGARPADAQPALVGVLSPGPSALDTLEGFRHGLRELGYVEGRNLNIEWRFANGSSERLDRFAAELVRLKVNAIFAINTQAAQAAKRASGSVPIVIARVADPVRSGLVASLAHPGGNITGVTSITEDLSAKRLQLLKEVLPKATRVALIWNSGNPGIESTVGEMEKVSPRFGLQLRSLPIRSIGDFQAAFGAATAARVDAVFLLDDLLVTSQKGPILRWASTARLPVISMYAELVDSGALMAYGPNTPEMYRRAAYFVDKILRGSSPADLPIEQPTQFELVINRKTANALGLVIPPSQLLRADRVIE